MGILRFLLALACVNIHYGGPAGILDFKMIPSTLAVQSFFLISGFYMSLVLGEKYSLDREGIRRFYFNRALRLFPTYWFLLALTMVIVVIYGRTLYMPLHDLWWNYRFLPRLHAAWLVLVNIFLVGQDSLPFMGIAPDIHQLQWTADSAHHVQPASRLLMIPASWSLSTEIWFYLLAPFLASKRWYWLTHIALLSVALRLVFVAIGWTRDPWNYRFFPTELLFFVSGMLLHRVYAKYHERVDPKWGALALVTVIGFLFSYEFLSINAYLKYWTFLAMFGGFLPLIFHFTKNNRLDRVIGDSSYPLYLCHIPVQMGLFFLLEPLGDFAYPTIALASVVTAFAINRWLEHPLERFRYTERPPAADRLQSQDIPVLDPRLVVGALKANS